MSLPIPDRTLLQAVDILTLSHETHVERQGAYLFTRQDPALIPALRAAIHGAPTIGSGATTPHHQRSILDPTLTELYSAIEKRIRNWARRTGYQPVTSWPAPEQLLRTWHAAYRGDTRAHEATLNTWIATISDLLIDPPRHWALSEECPVCGERWATTPDGRVDSLHITEREPAHHSEIVCRNPECGAHWDGVDGARALALAIDQHKAQKQQAS